MKPRLFTPGPTPIPERVQVAMAQPLMHHRGAEFKQLFETVLDDLKYFFQTKGRVLTLTSSGSGAMEAAVVNFVAKGDKVLTVNGGKFGERWGLMCRTYGADTHILDVEWGTAVDPDIIRKFLLENPKTSAVFVTHSETSTGVAVDVQAIAKIVRENSDAILIVDSVTSVGALPFKMDEWGIDVAVSGSQKGIMVPPGLAMIAISDRAWERVDRSDVARYYFDLKNEAAAHEKINTAWTPAITLIMGLREALDMVKEEGLENMWKKYAVLAQATREGALALNLELFAKSPSDSLTAIKIPESIDGLKFVKHLLDAYGIKVAGGQAWLKGKIFRIAHLGYYDALDMIAVTSALEMTLADFSWEFDHGAGVAAVQRYFMKSN